MKIHNNTGIEPIVQQLSDSAWRRWQIVYGRRRLQLFTQLLDVIRQQHKAG
jgi:hypothetical protein